MSRPDLIAAMWRRGSSRPSKFGHGVAKGLVPRVGAAERDLSHRVVQDRCTEEMAFGVLGVEKAMVGWRGRSSAVA